MTNTLLYSLKPILQWVPRVEKPRTLLKRKQKVLWTGITVFLYLVCSQIPIYGSPYISQSDPLFFIRQILASNKGSLMELGISPIITSGMFLSSLIHSKAITFDRSIPQDVKLLEQLEKLLSIIVSFCTSFVYVTTGMYGPLKELGFLNAFLIVMQLTFACVLVIYWDEMLTKGYGIGSGQNLFLVTNICESFFWKLFSPVTIKTQSGIQFEGIAVALFQFIVQKKSLLLGLKLALFRGNLVNLSNVIVTAVIFLFVLYIQNFHVNLPIYYKQHGGQNFNHKIKLFYLQSTPLILLTQVIQNVHVISELIYQRFGQYKVIRLFCQWKEVKGRNKLVGGLFYYLQQPKSIKSAYENHLQFFVQLMVLCILCGVFSYLYLYFSGQCEYEVLQQFYQQKIGVKGLKNQDSVFKVLKSLIPVAAVLGGVLIGLISALTDMLGSVIPGTNIFMLCNIIDSLYKSLKEKEQ